MVNKDLASEQASPEATTSAERLEGQAEPVIIEDSTAKSVRTHLTANEQKRHRRVRQHMQARRKRKAEEKLLGGSSAPSLLSCPLVGVNLRDVGAVTQGPMRSGRVFRSSELLSKEEMKKNNIKSILDLRRMDRPCKKRPGASKAAESTKSIIKYALLGPNKLIPEKRLLYVHRAHPEVCQLCEMKAQERFGLKLQVIHADLIPSTVGLRIFQSMPAKVQMKALMMACAGKGAASVMAPAVANPLLLGYKALYRTLLEDSKRGMALALRPFVDEGNYPILVHCIHGKDRTGLIIMLLLLLCNADAESIVDDYVLSETVLKESRMHDELKLDVYLTSDDVIAATRDTMEETIDYIKDKYTDAAGYMKEIGLEDWEISKIRENLMDHAALIEDGEGISHSVTKRRFSLQNFLPFARRVSAPPAEARVRPRLVRGSTPVPVKHLNSSKTMERVSEGSEPIESVDSNGSLQEGGSPLPRRASLANTDPAEIRGILRRMREQHPELGSMSEEDPIDFLRDSPRLQSGKIQSPTPSVNALQRDSAGRQRDDGKRGSIETFSSAGLKSGLGIVTDGAHSPLERHLSGKASEERLPPSPFA